MSLIERWVFWVLARLGIEVHEIGRKGLDRYLTRWMLWGFHCPDRGWIPWREHEANQAAGRSGCGEEGTP